MGRDKVIWDGEAAEVRVLRRWFAGMGRCWPDSPNCLGLGTGVAVVGGEAN
jgi:hypothetical protein